MKNVFKLIVCILVVFCFYGCDATDIDYYDSSTPVEKYPALREIKGEWVYKDSNNYYSLGDGVWTLFDSNDKVLSYGTYTYNSDNGIITLSNGGEDFNIFSVTDNYEIHDSDDELLRRKE